jgi:diguanylate cyclase (GGDEF)-like protein
MPKNSRFDIAEAPSHTRARRLLPRITSGVFRDLAVWMVGLGLLTGVVFPFFVIVLAVPSRIALQPVFMLACIAAGVSVGGLNFVLARNVVGQRIRNLNLRMRGLTAEVSETSVVAGREVDHFRPIPVDSDDELGESAAAFNALLVELGRAREAEAAARDAAEQRSRTDVLTSLHNRRHMWELLVSELERARRDGAAMGILLADIDHFKSINDTFGHLSGDAVLVEVADRLRAGARCYDTIARWGGEEFCVLAPGISGSEDLFTLAERLRDAIAFEPFTPRLGVELPVSISIGAVITEASLCTAEELLETADQALYAAKAAGRNCSRVADRAHAA